MKDLPINDTSRLANKIISACNDDFNKIINSGRWLLGEYSFQFSERFSNYIGVEFCLPLANGTDALEIALKTLFDGNRTEIVTVANAGGYTSTACFLSGLKPVYIDVNECDMLININELETVINKNTLAVVVTHLYGRAVDVIKVREKLDELGYTDVAIIEDCAQAHGAKINGKNVGSFGDLATFSFYPTKNLGALGDAGAITTNKSVYYIKAKALSQYGWSSKYRIDIPFSRNSRMDEIQAAVLIHLLPELDIWNEKRREIYTRYMNSTLSLSFYKVADESNVVHLALVRTKKRDKFIKYMNERGILVDVHYPILDSDQEAWKSEMKYSLHVSKMLSKEIVTLPCFPTMSDDEINRVCDALQGWDNE